MLCSEVLGRALAGSCSERRPWQPSAEFLGPHLQSPTNNFYSNHRFAICMCDKGQPVESKKTEVSTAMERSMEARRNCSIQSKEP
jgi:hypothetical protein